MKNETTLLLYVSKPVENIKFVRKILMPRYSTTISKKEYKT
jgi:hypothetical protein